MGVVYKAEDSELGSHSHLHPARAASYQVMFGATDVFLPSATVSRVHRTLRRTHVTAGVAELLRIRVSDVYETQVTAAPPSRIACSAMALCLVFGSISNRRLATSCHEVAVLGPTRRRSNN